MATRETPSRRAPVRERLLEAADELFYSRGIAGVGVDTVLQHSGAAIGSLYGHFGGKDGLVLAYLEERERRWRATWDAEVERHVDPRDRLLAIFDAQARWHRESSSDHGCAHAAALAQLAEGHPAREAARGHKRATRDRLVELAAELADPAGAPGHDPDSLADPDALADDLLLLHEGALVALSVGDRPDPVGRARGLAIRLVEPDRAGR